MQKINMSGYDMVGPYKVDGDKRVPETSGVYLVLTKTEDSKLRGVYITAADNLREHVDNNPSKECWKKNKIDGLSIWIYETIDMTEKERNKVLFKIREDRQYFMPCRD